MQAAGRPRAQLNQRRKHRRGGIDALDGYEARSLILWLMATTPTQGRQKGCEPSSGAAVQAAPA
eukprot:13080192-Alexandrium_andersonii.AAC.1